MENTQDKTDAGSYREFLDSKRILSEPCGFEVDQADLNPMLFPFQKDISGAWAGLCDWLMEECLIRAEMEAGMGASVGAKLPREVCH